MYALVNSIAKDPETPDHLRRFLYDHVDTNTRYGGPLYDTLSFISDLRLLTDAYELLNHDGQPFSDLGELVIRRLQATSDYDNLGKLVTQFSHNLEPLKDEDGAVKLDGLTLELAQQWVDTLNQREEQPRTKERRS